MKRATAVAALVALLVVVPIMPSPALSQQSGEADIIIQRERPPLASSEQLVRLPVWYVSRVKAKIAERWRPPAGTDAALSVTVAVDLHRDGQRGETTVQRTSGVPSFDASAVQAVVNAAPFPPFPAETEGSRARLTIEFR